MKIKRCWKKLWLATPKERFYYHSQVGLTVAVWSMVKKFTKLHCTVLLKNVTAIICSIIYLIFWIKTTMYLEPVYSSTLRSDLEPQSYSR